MHVRCTSLHDQFERYGRDEVAVRGGIGVAEGLEVGLVRVALLRGPVEVRHAADPRPVRELRELSPEARRHVIQRLHVVLVRVDVPAASGGGAEAGAREAEAYAEEATGAKDENAGVDGCVRAVRASQVRGPRVRTGTW